MIRRATQNLSYSMTTLNMQRAYARLFEAQRQVSTGKRIATPSDDPSSISRLMSFKQRAAEIEQFTKNAGEGKAMVDTAAASIQEVSDLVAQAREQVVQALNQTLSVEDRNTIAGAIDGILENILSLANSRVGGRYLFAGTATASRPFAFDGTGAGVSYLGNDDVILTEIGPDLRSPINVPGSVIFQGTERGVTRFLGNTGVRAGTGTDTGEGQATLMVANSSTTFVGGGLTSGASAATTDDVLGPPGSNTLQLAVDPTGTSGTISLNGGPAVAFTNPQTDLIVTGPDGESLSIDTTGVTAGFNGSVAITTTGTLSLDGGATTIPITYGPNQQLVDPTSGAITHVDTSGVRRAGVETIHYSGTYDLFESLIAIRDALTDAGTGTTLQDALERTERFLDELDGAHDRLLRHLGTLGTYGARIDAAESRLGDLDVRISELISKQEDIDLGAAVVDMKRFENSYQSALLVTSRVNQISLLNFL